MMKIENPNGIIKIRFDGFLSCLIVKKPRVADWPDCGGSVARYYACLPKDEIGHETQKDIENKVSSVKSIQDLKDSGFLSLLETGEYEFELWENKPTSILFNANLYNSNELVFKWQKEWIGNHRVAIPYFLNNFYPYGRQLMFSQPFEALDLQRIRRYEEKILRGERPLAIAIRVKGAFQDDEDSYQDTTYSTTKYVLDGHHKLAAYQNLKINPSYIVINRLTSGGTAGYDESILPDLSDALYYCQSELIVTNGLEQMRLSPKLAEYVDNFIKNATRLEDTLVSKILRNGTDSNYQQDPDRRLWFKNRMHTLIERANDNTNAPLYLDYWSATDFKKKYEIVKNWNEIQSKLKEQ